MDKRKCGETCTDKQLNQTNFKMPKPKSDFEEFKVNQEFKVRSPVKKNEDHRRIYGFYQE